MTAIMRNTNSLSKKYKFRRHPGPDTVFRVKGKMMCGFGIGGLIAAPQAPARIFGEQ
jgi:hypothetical protein